MLNKKFFEEFHIIIDLINISNDPASELNKKFTNQTNYLNKIKLYKKIQNNKKLLRYVYMSSCSVYGNNKNLITENSIPKPISLYSKLCLKYEKFLKSKKRGYGHWVWQTHIHQVILSKMNTGDIYHWCDVGCHFNKDGINRLKEYIKIVANNINGCLFFSYKKPKLEEKFNEYSFPKNLEYEYTKADLVKYFNLNFDDEIIQTPQVWGGSFFLRKCLDSEKLMKEHFEITRNKYYLIDDDESKFLEESHPGFIAHRHSQSVLSILAKKIDCNFLSAYESEWALDENKNRTYNHLVGYPVIAKRDKKRNIFLRFFEFVLSLK